MFLVGGISHRRIKLLDVVVHGIRLRKMLQTGNNSSNERAAVMVQPPTVQATGSLSGAGRGTHIVAEAWIMGTMMEQGVFFLVLPGVSPDNVSTWAHRCFHEASFPGHKDIGFL